MRGIQAVEVVMGWACFHSRDEILKFLWKYSQSLSCVRVVRNMCLSSKPTFRIDCLWLQPALLLDFPIVQWGEYFTMTFIAILTRWQLCRNSPNLKDGLHFWCFITFRQRFFLFQSTCFTLIVSLPFNKGVQSTGSTLDVSLPFVVKHDFKSNIREEIANIPADTLVVRVMANTRNLFIQCMGNEGRHLPDMIFKNMWNKTLNVCYHYETIMKLLWFIKLVLLPFGSRKLCCRTLY